MIRACLEFSSLALFCSFHPVFHPLRAPQEPLCGLSRAKNGAKIAKKQLRPKNPNKLLNFKRLRPPNYIADHLLHAFAVLCAKEDYGDCEPVVPPGPPPDQWKHVMSVTEGNYSNPSGFVYPVAVVYETLPCSPCELHHPVAPQSVCHYVHFGRIFERPSIMICSNNT